MPDLEVAERKASHVVLKEVRSIIPIPYIYGSDCTVT
jgi:hypothetical protein